ncbi:MAG TPA: class I SAM-dependent methyltransferase, partial [Fervidobacterium sp.]|nr:class I SAM-dependent methyltransferase [Fervidobacterium sp.]
MSRFSEVSGWTENENRRVILGLLERNDKARLIDLGCWNGSFTQKVAAKVGTQHTWGVEIDLEQGLNAEGKGVKVLRTDLNNTLPIENESFDVVLSNQVIEHISETDLLLKEMHRILREDGYAILSTPNLAAWHNIISLLVGLQPFSANVSN